MSFQPQIPLAGQEFRPREQPPTNDNTTEQGTVNSRAVGI